MEIAASKIDTPNVICRDFHAFCIKECNIELKLKRNKYKHKKI